MSLCVLKSTVKTILASLYCFPSALHSLRSFKSPGCSWETGRLWESGRTFISSSRPGPGGGGLLTEKNASCPPRTLTLWSIYQDVGTYGCIVSFPLITVIFCGGASLWCSHALPVVGLATQAQCWRLCLEMWVFNLRSCMYNWAIGLRPGFWFPNIYILGASF